MKLSRIAIVCGASIALNLTALSVSASAQAPTAFERAMLTELDAETRADVERRAVNGNTVKAVIGTTLLNNYYAAGARRPGTAVEVVAIDFSLGVVVFRRAPNLYEVRRFDPQTLRMR
jgi:hypothetical protein